MMNLGELIKKSGERRFINSLKKHQEIFITNDKNPVMEGFEYLSSDDYRDKPGSVKSRGLELLKSNGLKKTVRLMNHMRKIFPSILKNINMNFTDMKYFFDKIDTTGHTPGTPDYIISSYPNISIWEELKNYVWEKYRVVVGFTEVPEEYIFENKGIPFRYALVFAQEMKKEAIEKAPELDAGMEVANVYNSLGIATNEINHWLRDKYKIVGMANHPLGGLVDFIPLAEKAGLGKIGRHGLVITKEFGPRCRISPIFIDHRIFTDTTTTEHDWIKSFCQRCGNCVKNCPPHAIYSKPILSIEYGNEEIEDRYNAFDREKCFTSFSSHMGCSICIKVCPFSKNPNNYEKLHEISMNRS